MEILKTLGFVCHRACQWADQGITSARYDVIVYLCSLDILASSQLKSVRKNLSKTFYSNCWILVAETDLKHITVVKLNFRVDSTWRCCVLSSSPLTCLLLVMLRQTAFKKTSKYGMQFR